MSFSVHLRQRDVTTSRLITTALPIYACFARSDLQGFVARLAPDVQREHDSADRTLRWYPRRGGNDRALEFFASPADCEFRRCAAMAGLAGGSLVAVPIRLEPRVKATGKAIRDLEMHLWTCGDEDRVSRFRHFIDTRRFALAAA